MWALFSSKWKPILSLVKMALMLLHSNLVPTARQCCRLLAAKGHCNRVQLAKHDPGSCRILPHLYSVTNNKAQAKAWQALLRSPWCAERRNRTISALGPCLFQACTIFLVPQAQRGSVNVMPVLVAGLIPGPLSGILSRGTPCLLSPFPYPLHHNFIWSLDHNIYKLLYIKLHRLAQNVNVSLLPKYANIFRDPKKVLAPSPPFWSWAQVLCVPFKSHPQMSPGKISKCKIPGNF